MSKEINLTTFKNIFQTEEVKKELTLLSSWARGVKQERHIINILAKHLDRENFKFKTEYSAKKNKPKYDIRIEDVLVEVKFCFEEDVFQLKNEIDGTPKRPIRGNFLNKYLEWIDQRPKGWGRNFTALMLIDIFKKKCDYFILIVQSRDLRNIPYEDLENIVATERCVAYNKKYAAVGGYNIKPHFGIIEKLLESINKARPFNRILESVNADKKFPCTYHIYVLEFR